MVVVQISMFLLPLTQRLVVGALALLHATHCSPAHTNDYDGIVGDVVNAAGSKEMHVVYRCSATLTTRTIMPLVNAS